jgi:hypothetical protein
MFEKGHVSHEKKPRSPAKRPCTIRTRDGTMLFVLLNRATAIKIHCTECQGWETHPRDCASVLCALYPFRGASRMAYRKTTQKTTSDDGNSK